MGNVTSYLHNVNLHLYSPFKNVVKFPFSKNAWIRIRDPLFLDDCSEPEQSVLPVKLEWISDSLSLQPLVEQSCKTLYISSLSLLHMEPQQPESSFEMQISFSPLLNNKIITSIGSWQRKTRKVKFKDSNCNSKAEFINNAKDGQSQIRYQNGSL